MSSPLALFNHRGLTQQSPAKQDSLPSHERARGVFTPSPRSLIFPCIFTCGARAPRVVRVVNAQWPQMMLCCGPLRMEAGSLRLQLCSSQRRWSGDQMTRSPALRAEVLAPPQTGKMFSEMRPEEQREAQAYISDRLITKENARLLPLV